MSLKAKLFTTLLITSLTLIACSDSDPEQAVSSEKTEQSKTSNMNKSSTFQRIKQHNSDAPMAERRPHTEQHHGKTLSDSYAWLKDEGYPEVDDQPVLDYLKLENAYYAEFLEPNRPLVDTVFEEFKGRTDETEESVPFIKNGFEYKWYFREGEEYRTRSRKNLTTGEEAVFLDETKLAKDHKYFVLGDWAISPDNRYLAYSFDTAGDERYQIKIINLQTGKYLEDVLQDVEGDLTYNADGSALIYALLEKDRWLAKNIKVHKIGQPQSKDETLYYEEDDGFFIGFGKTSSEKYILISATQGEIQESYVVPSNLSSKPVQLVSREAEFQQTIDHAHGHFYIIANDTHKNGRLVKVADSDPSIDKWQTLQEGSDQVYLLGLQTFNDFIAIKSRDVGLEKIHIRKYAEKSETEGDDQSHTVEFPESLFTASLGGNFEFDQGFVRLNYESMITPNTVFDYRLSDRVLVTRKTQKIPSGYNKADYITERIMATARDGAQIPVSIVYKKGFSKDASHPMWLYGYGAYAATIEPSFSTLRLSALDRGFSFAIAHVRGGAMMGYQWYLDGKLEKRNNTFNDFVDVAKHLVKEEYVAAGNISASGRSAGGELMGAVTIQAPELWRSVNLGVPFVDVLNTMLDASLPLTPPEWKEWGNPIESAEDYALIESYSPYDNIQELEYPPMFVSGGLNDPRVTYWEPAKWTAKMRYKKTDDNLLVMRINMGAGHFANSGRYGRLKDYAEEFTFMFLAHGIKE